MNNINFFADRLRKIGDEALKEALYLNLNVNEVLLSYEIAGIPSPIMIKRNTLAYIERGGGSLIGEVFHPVFERG